MANRIQLRRDGAQQWANINPILAQGELGIEIDTSRIKIGDGVTPWNSLKYERPLETESNAANTLVKRDADGNFQAGAITATLIGNASTATRLANARQIQLTGQITGSGSFDGSANLNLNTDLSLITTLPHYNPNDPNAEALYTRVRVNSQGRVVGAELASTLSDYGITDAQPLDDDLTSLSTLTTVGILCRASQGNVVTRQLTGGGGRIIFTVPDGSTQNPFIDLADTTVVVGSYNTEALTSSGTGSETVNATKFTVDRYGRLTAALTVPIATATEGSKYAAFNSGTAYNRYDIIEEGGRVYQAYVGITAGQAAPTHNSGDNNGWRFLNNAAVEQKGLASFAQEDFDVDANGHVTIALSGVDNTQLENNRIIFTDGNTVQHFELDDELTTANAHTGFDYLNYIKVNDTSGNLLFGANNTGNSGAGDVDINVTSHISGEKIILDRSGVTPLQTIERTAGSLKIHHNVSSATDRVLDIVSNNAGSGTAIINVTADNGIVLTATDAAAKVQVEDFYFQENHLGTSNGTLVLDPEDDDGITGTVQIRGNLQVDGTTTTVNSTTITVDDPIIVLGGDTAPTTDDGKDRGVEFSYYDSQARVGFYGWDESVSRLDGGTGGYAFLYNATNTNEVFSGVDAYLKAGALSLTTNTGSTSTTTGTLVVTGGAGISENVYIGGTTDIAGDVDVNSGKFYVTASNGNVLSQGDLNIQGNVTLGNASSDTVTVNSDSTFEDDVRVVGPNTVFSITDGTAEKFVIDTDNGNTHSDGTLDVDGGVTFNSTLDVDAATTLNSTLDVDAASTFHDNMLLDTTGKTFTITNGTANKFQISSTNGNTDIEGTLNVAQFVHLEDTDDPTISTDANDNFVISGGDYGSFRFDGGGYIEGDTLFNSDLYLNGSLNQKDLGATETFSTQNYLRVRYKLRAGSTIAYTPSYATHGNSNLRVYGGAGIATDLHIGDDLYIGKLNSGDTVEFSVLGESGNTEIGRVGQGSNSAGTLTVHGEATFNNPTSFTHNVTVGNANTDTLTVNSVATFTDNATVNGDFTVDGNTVLEGNLTVNGSTTTINSTTQTLDDPVFTLGGDTAPSQADAKDRGIEFRYYSGSAKIGFFGWDNSASRFALYHNATNSSEAFSGTRSGIDAGSIKLFDTTNATNTSSGALIVGGGAGIGLDLYVGDDLSVGDDTAIGGNLDVTGDFDLTDDFRINTNKFTVAASSGNTLVAGTFTSAGQATLQQGLAVSSNTTVGGTLGVTAATTLSSTLAVTSNTTVGGTFDVSGASNVNNTLGVTGITTITNASAATTTGSYSGDGALRVTGGASIGGNLVAQGNVRVYGNSVFDGTVNYAGIQTYTEKARFNNSSDATSATNNGASIFTSGGLAVTKKAFIGDDLDVGAGNFTVDGPTGNSTVAGTLGVTGATTLTSLSASGVADLQSTLTLGGNFSINTNKFVVASSTGNTDIAGALDVTGTTELGVLNADNNVDFSGTSIAISNSNSTTNVSGIMRILKSSDSTGYNNTSAAFYTAGGASISKRLNVGGNFMVGGSGGVKTTITATNGNISTDGTLNVAQATTIGGTLGVTGQITGNLTGDVTGTATNADNIDITNTNNNTTFYPMFAAANTGHTGAFVDSQNLTYNPYSNTLSVTNFVSTTNFEVQGNLNVTGTITFFQSQVGSIANHDTDALAEGTTNLYFTDERVDDRVASLISGGTGISATYDDAGNLLTLSAVPADINTDNLTEGSTNIFYTEARFDASLAGKSTSDLTEGTNLYYTDTRADARVDAGFVAKSTSDLSEGTNLYYTDARADARIAAATTTDLSEGTNLYYTDARADARIAAATTDDLSEGATNLYFTNARAQAAVSASDVGLGSVDNTADADKPVSTAQQTALDAKADLASPSLTGTPTAPTASQSDDSTQIATTAFVQSNLTASLLRSALGIPEYANNGGANSGGLSSGDVYFNTTTNTYTTVS